MCCLTRPMMCVVCVLCMLSTAIAYGCAAKRRNGAALPVHLKQVRRSGKTLRLSASQPNQKLTRSVRASVLNVQGNTFLKNGDVNKALECYNTALSVCDDDQQCALFVMRGTALLQRAYDCKMRFNDVLKFTTRLLPSAEAVWWFWEATSSWPTYTRNTALAYQLGRARSAYLQLDQAATWGAVRGSWQEAKEGEVLGNGQELLQRAVYTWALYESALNDALEDCMSATLLRPDFAQAWRRAAGALSELGLYERAIEYYGVAMRLDTSLQEQLYPTVARLRLLGRSGSADSPP